MTAAQIQSIILAIAATVCLALPPTLIAATNHPNIECSVEAQNWSLSKDSPRITLNITCATFSFTGHHKMSANVRPLMYIQNGPQETSIMFTLEDASHIGWNEKQHPDLFCQGNFSFVPDAQFSTFDKYEIDFLCQEGWGYHSELFCESTRLGPETSPITVLCRPISSASKRHWRWRDIGGDLVIDAVGTKSGKIIAHVYSPEITFITLRRWRSDDSITNKVIPVVNGVAVFKAKSSRLSWGRIVLGDGGYEWGAYWKAYIISPTIWWGQ
jgi:hypothetical protein